MATRRGLDRRLQQGKVKEYLSSCVRRIELFREHGKHKAEARVFAGLANCLYDQSDWEQCIQACRDWLSRIPPLPEHGGMAGAWHPHFLLSKSLQRQGDLVGAEDHARLAVELNRPGDDDTMHVGCVTHYAMLLARQGRRGEAIGAIEAADSRARHALAYGHMATTLAEIHRMAGELDLALTCVDRPIAELEPCDVLPKVQAKAQLVKAAILLDRDGVIKRAEVSAAIDAADALLDDPEDPRRRQVDELRSRLRAML